MAEKAVRKRASKTAQDKGRPAPASKGHNSGALDEDASLRKWLPKIASAKAASDKAQEEAKQEKGRYRAILKAAKKEGVDTDAVIEAREWEKDDPAERARRLRYIGRVLAYDKSPLATQMDLFQNIVVPDPLAARSEGLAAGKNAEPAENNPYTPGGEEFEAWAEGWAAGQEANQNALRERSLN